ncbi:hypothetical protein GCM10018785_53510 [Streptomyces longispororuber]|uniref:Uncharacterized protein n=1 Tax=Streptomyces longispororuber TaxID=68230 RepID=A0A919DUC5_9ACTN|nr:hypothetical protein GCM10018785_53510 [Streptomyces longispororuber]
MDGLARAEEEAGADGTADGDHLDLPRTQAALVALAVAGRAGARRGTIAAVLVVVFFDLH